MNKDDKKIVIKVDEVDIPEMNVRPIVNIDKDKFPIEYIQHIEKKGKRPLLIINNDKGNNTIK